jgi:hypothetical protein
MVALAAVSTLHAQATRTWVSGVGDDANPCSRTAPCKTFAGAISKTAASGEISVLDPGGFGAVTITKSITIDGGGGSGFAGILAALVNGIIVNAAGIDVTLRNISIDGAGSGLIGIKILAANRVHIENCQIFGFTGADPNGRGISDERTAGGKLFVTNTVVRNNRASGLVILPSTGPIITAELDHLQLTGNGNAGLAAVSTHCTISNSIISGNTNFGLDAEGSSTLLTIESCVIASNGTGIVIGSGAATVRISNVLVTDNATGLSPGAGSIFSFGNNKIAGNGAGNGPPSGTVSVQ